MVTYTPIPYWLSLPWVQTRGWAETVIRIQEQDRAASERK